MAILDEIQRERFFKWIDHIKTHVPLTRVAVDLGVVRAEAIIGGEFQLKCPFHGKDDKPSAHVYQDGLFHCFTCKRHYNVINFVANYRGMTFGQAGRWLEKTYSVPKLDLGGDLPSEEAYPKEVVKGGVEKTLEIPYEDRFKAVEKKIMDAKRTLGLETYARAFFALDLTKETKSVEQLTALEEKIDAKLQTV